MTTYEISLLVPPHAPPNSIHGELESILHELRTAIADDNTPTRETLIGHLGTTLGHCSRRTVPVLEDSTNPLHHLPQDPIWYECLDSGRAGFREFIRTALSLSLRLVTTCSNIPKKRTPRSSVPLATSFWATDAVCINLVNFLGTRTMCARFSGRRLLPRSALAYGEAVPTRVT